MATVRDIIWQAFQKIGVKAADEPLDAAHQADGLSQFNMMLHEWKLSSVDIEHTDLTVNDTFPLDPEFQYGTIHMLAMRLAPDYAVPANFNADDFFRRIQAAYYEPLEAEVDEAIIRASSRYRRNYY